MTLAQTIDLLVLDAHGVVFSSAFPTFLSRLASAQQKRKDDVERSWSTNIRLPAWIGAITEEQVWSRLEVPYDQHNVWREVMHGCYEAGPAAKHLANWSDQVPIWLLSNHRSEWLMPRLKHFQLDGYFARILVSDTLGALKPSNAAFRPIVEFVSDPSRVLFVDDQQKNLESAVQLGMKCVRAKSGDAWTNTIDDLLDS